MVENSTKIALGTLVFILLASGVYVNFDNGTDCFSVRIRNDDTTFLTKQNCEGRFLVGGREEFRLFNGTKIVNRNTKDIQIVYFNESPQRVVKTVPYSNGVIINHTYLFSSDNYEVENFPISHVAEVYNGKGLFYRYTVRDLTSAGPKRKLINETRVEFGRNMVVELQEGYRWAWIGYPYGKDSLTAQYDVESDYEVFVTRLFDPPTQSTPVLNSTFGTNTTSENLTCYNQSTSNASAVNIYGWYKDGNRLEKLNMPFEYGSNSTYTRNYASATSGTVSSATWTETGGYAGSGAYIFNGDDGTGNVINTNLDLDIGVNGITILARVKVNATQNGTGEVGYIVQKDRLVGSTPYAITVASITPAVAMTGTALFGNNLTFDQWYSIGLVYDGTNMTMYQDGIFINSTVATQTDNNEKTTIGSSEDTPTYRPFKGIIDEVLIIDNAWSGEQILSWHNNNSNMIVSEETSLGEVWQCEITPNDASGDGSTTASNNLTIILPNPPTQDTPILNSSDNTCSTNSNLTVYNISSVTVTGRLKNIINWYQNSTLLNVVNLPFEGGSTTTNTKNYGSTSNGKVIGATWSNSTGWDGNGAYYFDGSSSSITLTGYKGQTGTSSRSGVMWVKANETADAILSWGTNTAGLKWIVRTNDATPGTNGGFRIEVNGGYIVGTTSLIDDVWHCLAYTLEDDGSPSVNETKLYVDGNLETISASLGKVINTDSGNDVMIGNDSQLTGREFLGYIDDVQLFDYALTPEQISVMCGQNKTDTIVSQETSTDDVWYAEITPNDLIQDGTTAASNTLTLNGTCPSSDTCTYTSGDWEVTCSDNCTITSDVVVSPNNLILTGTGIFTVQADINVKNITSDYACYIDLESSGAGNLTIDGQ